MKKVKKTAPAEAVRSKLLFCIFCVQIVGNEAVLAFSFQILFKGWKIIRIHGMFGENVVPFAADYDVVAVIGFKESVHFFERCFGIVRLSFDVHFNTFFVDGDVCFLAVVEPDDSVERVIVSVPPLLQGDQNQNGTDNQVADVGNVQTGCIQAVSEKYNTGASKNEEQDSYRGGKLLLLPVDLLKIVEDGGSVFKRCAVGAGCFCHDQIPFSVSSDFFFVKESETLIKLSGFL
jgi:hypothetical protein